MKIEGLPTEQLVDTVRELLAEGVNCIGADRVVGQGEADELRRQESEAEAALAELARRAGR